MALFLIRHGETSSNATRVVQTPDTPLSERGLAQAAALAKRLANAGIAQIIASDLERAHQTARALAESTGALLDLDPLLHERNFGDVRGTPYSKLAVDLFGLDFQPPGGESWAVFHRRVDRAWERAQELASVTDGHLAVVTHGLVCHSIVSRLETGAPTSEVRAGFPNTSVTEIDGPPWRITRLACTAHLDGIDEGASDGGAAV